MPSAPATGSLAGGTVRTAKIPCTLVERCWVLLEVIFILWLTKASFRE